MNRIRVQYKPSFIEERKLVAKGYQYTAGIDEAGRGALAGPVVAAAVILPHRMKTPWLNQVRDSKLLNPSKREHLFGYIKDVATSIGIGIISHQIIDAQNIIKATHLAMIKAISQLSPEADSLLIDYIYLPGTSLPQWGIINGDGLCFSIACASIIAKVTRDHLMKEMDTVYPGYGMAKHKGYCTNEHISNLKRLGPSPIHRCSFRPVSEMLLE